MTTTRGRFQKGQSGNPAGKRQGSRNRATRDLDHLFDGEAEAITRKAIDMAKEGDAVALRLCLDRIVPPRRERRLYIDLPPITSADDAVKAHAAIVAAVAGGELTPGEASDLASLVDNVRRAIETGEIAARLSKLEEALSP